MLDLDFAFFNLINQTKTGLAYKKVILDMLAPFFFAPRLKKVIKIPYLESCGGNFMLPLGMANLNDLQPEGKRVLAQRIDSLLQEYKLSHLAVDRRLKNAMNDMAPAREIVYGDNFIKALAHVFIKGFLHRYGVRKIIIVGTTEEFPNFIASLARYNLPISLQAFCPRQHELFTHQLLYEKGQAVSISYLNPENWERDDLIIIFADRTELITGYGSAGVTIYLNDCSCHLAPGLNSEFERNGLLPALYNLAPILESCLLAKAGIMEPDTESNSLNPPQAAFLTLEELGYQWGLWELFLDKV